jgi:ketosteroid isomerase-like protein
MRQTALGALGALTMVMAAACGGSKQVEFTTKDGAAIRQRSEAFVQAFNAKQIPQVLDLYTDNSTFEPPNQPIMRGRDALRIFFTDLIDKEGATNLRLSVDEVSGQGTLAYQAGTYELDYKPATGTPSHDRGKYLFILRTLAGTWRYQFTMWNSDLPPQKHAGDD